MVWKRWEDTANLLLGVWLFVSLYVFLFPGGASVLVTFGVGTGVVVVALWTLGVPDSRAAEACQLLLASGYFVAPWALGFAEVSSVPAWNTWVVSLLVAGLAAAALHAAGDAAAVPDRAASRDGRASV
jgi:hypothetical protein